MIRPTSLLRSDSAVPTREFSAPVSNIKEGSLDCGITALPCCLPSWFHKFASPNVFIFFFVLLGIVQGSAQAYFISTARYIGELFNYSSEVIDWLLVSHEIFQGIFVLIVAYWGNRIHRIAWLGGLTCFQGFSCFLVFIPYLEHIKKGNNSIINTPQSNLCLPPSPYANLELVTDGEDICWITLVTLFVLQLFFGLANASFFSHGLSYIDDNSEKTNSPIYIAAGLAVKMSSLQFGSFMAWSFLSKDGTWWIGYPILGSCLIIAGSLIATFPRSLLNTVLKQTAASILDIATRTQTNREIPEGKPIPSPNFFPTFRRLVTNKVILINAIATVFLEMGIKNFAFYEDKFIEAQYYLSIQTKGFNDPWTSRLITTILKPPIMTLSMLVTGLIIAKLRPRTRCVAIWCVLTTLAAVGICLSYGFIDCKKDKITGEYNGRFTAPYCSHSCNCEATNAKFEPVCVQNSTGTYYSPCYAGCKEVIYVNDVKLYSKCSCGVPFYGNTVAPPAMASEGACDNKNCAIHWKMFQALTMITTAILGSGYMANFLINLRAVHPNDKAMAIGFELFLASLLANIPGKVLYKYVSEATCQFPNKDGYNCNLHNENFGDIISYLTAGLLLISVIFDIVIIFVSKDVELHKDEDDDDEEDVPMHTVPRPQPRTIDSGFTSPARVSHRSSNMGSRASTGVTSIEYNNPETQPLNRDEIQRNVVEELRSLRSTRV